MPSQNLTTKGERGGSVRVISKIKLHLFLSACEGLKLVMDRFMSLSPIRPYNSIQAQP